MRSVFVLLILFALCCAASLGAAQSSDPLTALLARPADDAWLASDLHKLLIDLPPAERAKAMQAIASARRPDLAAEVVAAVQDRDPVVAAAAIAALGTLWPTSVEHATVVRNLIADAQPGPVAVAAISFAMQVGDDRAIPDLARRLQRIEDDVRARDALRRLTGKDFSEGGGAWLAWYDERVATLKPLLEQLSSEVAAPDAAVATRAVQRLMGLKEQPSAVGEILVVAARHPAKQVRDMAAVALRLIGGPVAGCWKPESLDEEEPLAVGHSGATSGAAVVAARLPTAAQASNDLMALAIFAGLVVVLVGVVLSLRRKPAPVPAKAVVAPNQVPMSTRIIRRRERMTWLN